MRVRPAAVAGTFYTGSPSRLRTEIESKLVGAESSARQEAPCAVIVPHAGYLYSGETAARTFAACRNGKYRRALLIAPSHRVPLTGIASCSFDAYETPLGQVRVDQEANSTLVNSSQGSIRESDSAHIGEHALEVELPFLQIMFPELPVVPLICGAELPGESVKNICSAMQQFWNPETLWIISCDFTHYGASFCYVPFRDDIPENIAKLDNEAIKRILELDAEGFRAYIERTGATICGRNPIYLLLRIIENSDTQVQAELIDYKNSGAISRDWSHCVSYAGICFFPNNNTIEPISIL